MRTIRNEAILASVFFCFIQLITSDIMSRDYGEHFTNCIRRITVKNRKTALDLVGTNVQFYCKSIEQFRTSHERDFPGKRLTQDESDWVYGLLERGEILRVKRQAAGNGNRRQEYRTLSDRQRLKYHAAIQGLKARVIGNSTQYDILARVHTGITQITAHGGCNFLGWHRVYLNMYESALQLVDPSVTLPYWDSTLDHYMPKDDQENSIIWGDDFLGTPHGVVVTGFAANWTSDRFGPLTRNVGRAQGAALMSDEEIQGVINKTRMHEICGDNSQIEFDLEFIHGPPHIFVDGQMGNIESAAYEPAFYMHHAFIDLIWELFRENSLKNGVDVENDYPAEGFGDLFHHGDRAMGLGNRTIKDGLLNREIKGKYFYAPRPTCTLNGRQCPGKYLKCVSIEGRPKCISKTIKEVEEERLRPTTPPPPTLPPLECPKPNYPHDPHKEQRAVQNTFCANGKSDSDEWVYLPVQILTARAPDYSGYKSYNVKNGQTDQTSDLYNPKSYSQLSTYIRPGRPKTFQNCHTENGTAGQIFIQSDGLNYEGTYKDFAIIDNRLAISVSITYVAIKDPEKTTVNSPDQQYKYSDVLLSAFDSCGRLCRANCLVPGKVPPTYRPCTGALRVTPDALQGNFYGKDYGGASENIWDFRRERSCPQYKTDQIFVSFYCDYSNRWPWILSDTPVESQPSPFINQPPVVPAEPALKECAKPLPWDNFGNCLVESTDCNARCTSTQISICKGTCDEYYWCAKGREGVTMCKYGQRFDYVGGKPQCVPATMDSCPESFDRRKRYLARLALTRGRNRGRGGRRRWK